MPSLRRTVSESYSNPRSSPYPSTLSLSASGALNANNGNNSFRMRRAASGSETSTRRVLADIEWWRVTSGQQVETDENAHEEDTNHDSLVADDAASVTTTNNLADEERSSLDAAFVLEEDGVFSTSDASQGAASLASPFASLSILDGIPQTPPRSRSVSASSAESSPESSPRTPAMQPTSLLGGEQPTLGLDLGLGVSMDFGCSAFSDIAIGDSESSLPSCLSDAQPSTLNAISMLRSASFGTFEMPRESFDDRFGDVLFV